MTPLDVTNVGWFSQRCG